MSQILKYVGTYKKATIIALALMVTELIVELVQPMIMATIIDEGIAKREFDTVMIWSGVLLGLTVVAFVAGIVSSFYASESSQGVSHDLRRDLFRRVQSFSALQMQRFSTPSLITRMTADITQIQGLLFMFMRIGLRAPLFILFGLVAALSIHAKLALILVLVIPVLVVVMYWIMTQGLTLFSSVQTKLDDVNRAFRENLLGIRLVKAYHRINHEKERFFKVNQVLVEFNKKALWLMEVTMPILMLVINGSIVVILWYGYKETAQGGAQPGQIVAILNYATRMLASFGVFSFIIMNLSRGRASSARITEVLQEKEEEPITELNQLKGSIKGDIQLQHVSFTYPNSVEKALDNISLDIKAWEKVGVLGETGSGKSTLLQLIPLLYPVTAGRLLIDGKSVGEKQGLIRDHVSLVPQEVQLFSGTIKENIAWGNKHATMEEIVQAAKDANIHDFINQLEEGYETKIGQRGVNLSGGQKQRVSIARALIKNPSILLLDDSTSALDAKTERKVLQAIKDRKCTTVIVAQKVSSVIDADQIVILQHGKVVGIGSHADLLADNTMYRQIYQSQMNEDVISHG
ncbi:ABC transporter ATP-binding protein [Aquibacillus salsiterrae]|uniref:ABC transporter ATP-binding protein/permease n=1 Tax=Aquibacillus salsiterrae TaxID=2950439 RepID=A0A9X3WG66_9BACI|nr:ABC transporter ATP-binding protein [Aquibacillus salsiterrae]MDC3416849.1 ABC transporter ATP-binding protein/permease [Aquibacillus salsiterrae]